MDIRSFFKPKEKQNRSSAEAAANSSDSESERLHSCSQSVSDPPSPESNTGSLDAAAGHVSSDDRGGGDGDRRCAQ